MSLSSLQQAVRQGNVQELSDLINQCVDLNQNDDVDENSLLHLAVEFNNEEILTTLLRSKIDINLKDRFSRTALQKALKLNNFAAAKKLIYAKVDVNNADRKKKTALHSAAKKNSDEIIQDLLSHGANVNAKDYRSLTPLHKACDMNKYSSHKKTIRLLLMYEAKVNELDYVQNTPLNYLIRYEDPPGCDVVRMLLSHGADLHLKDRLNKTPLIRAVNRGYSKIVKLLIDWGSNVNNDEESDIWPLHEACLYEPSGTADIIKSLVYNGADTTARNHLGYTPLNALIRHHSLLRFFSREEFAGKLKFLLKYSDVNYIDPSVMVDLPGAEWTFILEHLAKLMALKLPVRECFVKLIYENPQFEIYFQYCARDLYIAKNTYFDKSKVSHFDLLVEGRKELESYAGDSNLVAQFENADFTKKYPVYGRAMCKRIAKGIVRRVLVKKSVNLLRSLFLVFDQSSSIVMDIVSCLSTRDLVTLLRSE